MLFPVSPRSWGTITLIDNQGFSVITELRLRGLEKLLSGLCPLHGTIVAVTLSADHKAEVVCQYEGHARILKGLLSKKENVAQLRELGYEEVAIKLGNRPKPIAIAEVFDFPL